MKRGKVVLQRKDRRTLTFLKFLMSPSQLRISRIFLPNRKMTKPILLREYRDSRTQTSLIGEQSRSRSRLDQIIGFFFWEER